MSIGVFCTVAKDEYPLLRYTLRPFLDLNDVECVLILHTGKTPHPDFGSLATSDRVVELHRDFGEGYDFSVADGGYDQLSARNFAIDFLEATNADWLIQFDADEYITETALPTILGVPDHFDVVAFSRYTLLSRQHFWFEPKILRVVNDTRLLDPHLVIWRRSLKKRNELCAISAQIYPNHTRHCAVSFQHHPRWKVYALDEPLHFHLHCFLGKRNSGARRASRALDDKLPDDVLTCLDRIEAVQLIRSHSHALGHNN